MNHALQQRTIQFLLFQRNIFALLCLFLALSGTVLTIFLFSKRERIVIVPPVVEKTFWVDAHRVAPTYLEQFGYFLGQLLLAKSPDNAPTQRIMLLRHVDPAFYGALRDKLLKEEELLREQNATYVFYPHQIHVDPSALQVTLSGERVYFVRGNQISKETESYVLSFVYNGSRLLLKGVQAKERSHAP